MNRFFDDLILTPLRELQFLASIRRGISSVPPPSIKLRILRSLLKLHQPDTSFIAAGTCVADAVARIRRLGHPVISIERDAAVYEQVQRRFRDDPDVVLVRGDSVYELSQVLSGLARPAMLWLDDDSSRRRSEHPIFSSLAEMQEQPIRSHSLLINNAASFDGRNSRPDVLEVLAAIRAINPAYRIKLEGDMIVALMDRTTSFHCGGWRVHLSSRTDSSRTANPNSTNHQHPSPNRTSG
jgi:hypothetical protein